MYQVTFSEQSMRELNRLDKLAQLVVIEPISRLTPEDLANPREPLGRFSGFRPAMPVVQWRWRKA